MQFWGDCLAAGACYERREKLPRRQKPGDTPKASWAGVFLLDTVFKHPDLLRAKQVTAPPQVLFLKAALKLFTSCKNKCDLHLIWVITFTVN